MIGKRRELYGKRFRANQLWRKVEDLKDLVQQFHLLARDLDVQVRAEEERTGVTDRSSVCYSLIANAAAQRRDNLLASLRELNAELRRTTTERDAAIAELDIAAITIARLNEQVAHESPSAPAKSPDPLFIDFPRRVESALGGDHESRNERPIKAVGT